jgi:hypothetical protein
MSFFKKTAPAQSKTIPPVRTARFGAYRPLSDVLKWEQVNGVYAKRKRELPKYEQYLLDPDEADSLSATEDSDVYSTDSN